MPNQARRQPRVFPCHASQKPIERDLSQKSDAEDWIHPWLYQEKLLPGEDWHLEIEKVVKFFDAVIVRILSTPVAKAGYVQKELRQVLNISLKKLEGTIIHTPLRLDNYALARNLTARRFLDYFPASKQDAAFDESKASLTIRKDGLGI